jgi:hypothetical protein
VIPGLDNACEGNAQRPSEKRRRRLRHAECQRHGDRRPPHARTSSRPLADGDGEGVGSKSDGEKDKRSNHLGAAVAGEPGGANASLALPGKRCHYLYVR